LKKLTGNTDLENSLERLDKLTQEEARMASAEQLKMSHSIDGRVKNVEEKVQDARGDVHDVGIKVQDVDYRVQSVGSNISSGVQGVNDRLDQVNRSSFLQHLLIVPRAKTTSQ
jgi:hypothetical protein